MRDPGKNKKSDETQTDSSEEKLTLIISDFEAIVGLRSIRIIINININVYVQLHYVHANESQFKIKLSEQFIRFQAKHFAVLPYAGSCVQDWVRASLQIWIWIQNNFLPFSLKKNIFNRS